MISEPIEPGLFPDVEKGEVLVDYLIGINGEIKRTEETHKMIAADYEDYAKGFSLAGYKEIKFLGENEWTRTRGLFVPIKWTLQQLI